MIISILSWIEEPMEDSKALKIDNSDKPIGPRGLWTRCDNCGTILYIRHLKANQRVCFACGYHLQMNSRERIKNLIDAGTWRPLDETLSPGNPLEFCDKKTYTERLKEAQERTNLQDAIVTGTGLLDGIPVALGAMDFDFMGGSMGSVVGEKITRLIEHAAREGYFLILICASGGARMQEGIFSLMQMAKIAAALQIYQSSTNLLYLSILTSPTTGGVTASFAMLGDLIFAEPNALIGFAGRRVIEQTLQETLPEDFQTAEYFFDHGLCDLIIPRSFLKPALCEIISLYKDTAFKKHGQLSTHLQYPFDFLTEERVRRKYIQNQNSENKLDFFDQFPFMDLANQVSFLSRFLYNPSMKFFDAFVSKKTDLEKSSEEAKETLELEELEEVKERLELEGWEESKEASELGDWEEIEEVEKYKEYEKFAVFYKEILSSLDFLLKENKGHSL